MDAKSIRYSPYITTAPGKNQSEMSPVNLDESDLAEIPDDPTDRMLLAGKCLDAGEYVTLKAIAKQYGSLKFTDMTCNRWETLCELLRNQLCVQSLEIGGNNLEERGLGQLNFLTDDNAMVCLDISGNNFSIETIQTFSGIFRKNRSLTSLNLGRNDITSVGITSLMNASKERNTLMGLYLDDINVSASKRGRAEALARGLESNYSITALSPAHNDMDDKNAELIAKSLIENRTLTSLNLRENRITTAGANAFIKVARNNRTLMSIDLSNKHLFKKKKVKKEINPDVLKELEALLKANELYNDRFHQYKRVVIFVDRYVMNQFKEKLPFELAKKIASHLDTETYERINQWVKA